MPFIAPVWDNAVFLVVSLIFLSLLSLSNKLNVLFVNSLLPTLNSDND